jgi:hypothetical protein
VSGELADAEVQVMFICAQIERTVNESGALLVALARLCENNPRATALAERLLSEAGAIEVPRRRLTRERRPVGRTRR